MYRCTDCGQEFEIKPEYCDCGNNVFEEILPAKSPEPVPAAPYTPRPPKTARQTVDLPSLLIFLICIVLSVLSWIFIGRESGEKPEAVPVNKPKPSVEIPSIDELWKETSVKPAQPPVPEIVQSAVEEVKKIITIPKKDKKTPAKQTSVKPAQPVKTVSNRPEATKPSMTDAQKQAIIKRLTSSPQPVKKVEPVKTVEAKPVPKAEPPKVDYAAQKRELAAYKVALRNKIGGNINFAAVIGDGRCAITFKLDSSGNLVNRAFSQQSDNDSLNDAVYAAMMQNPTFKAPPAGYKNETLTLSVRMYGGQFEVDLK